MPNKYNVNWEDSSYYPSYSKGAVMPPGHYMDEYGREYVVQNGEIEIRYSGGSMGKTVRFDNPYVTEQSKLEGKKDNVAGINNVTVEFPYNNQRNGVQGMTLNEFSTVIKQLRDYVNNENATVVDITQTYENDGDHGVVKVTVKRPTRKNDPED